MRISRGETTRFEYGWPGLDGELSFCLRAAHFATGSIGLLHAQSNTGTIFGRATDDKGNVLPDVQVTARNLSTNASTVTRTDTNGSYTVPSLAPGQYSVISLHAGFQSLAVDVSVAVGEQNPTLTNFEPRVGFAWDPTGSGKVVIRSGFGIFDVLPLSYEFELIALGVAPFFENATPTQLPAGSFFSQAIQIAIGPNGTHELVFILASPKPNGTPA